MSQLNIWIDGYEANVPQRLGSSQVAFELLKNIELLDKKNSYTILLPSASLDDLPKERVNWKYKILKPTKLWTKIALPLALYTSKEKPDLIFSPTHYSPQFSPVKRVVTIFDLAYLYFPEMLLKKDLWKLKNWTKSSVEKASHIITISNFTKQSIVKEYGIDKKIVTVAYPGSRRELYHQINDVNLIKSVKEKYKIPGDYFLYIGTIQPRKNLIRLIEAFAQVVKDKKELSLVIVGKTKGLGREGWMYEEVLNRPKEIGIEDKVIFTGFAPTEDLPLLMNGAIAFVWPSLWEGFGIPVVDSMNCGTPVIVSNVSSLPEIVNQSGLLVDPKSVDQIAQAMRTISADKKLRLKLSKLGLQQAQKYTWEKMAKTVIKVFEDMVNKE